MSEETKTRLDEVFINCPFDQAYAPTFQALIFGLWACQFRPRSALEIDDGSQARIEKIYAIIEQCRYGVHDLCRTQPHAVHGLPRFNMPLELGIFLGAKRYGDDGQKQKRCLIFDIEQFRYQKFASDLAGMDIHAHGGDPRVAIQKLRNWLANMSRRDLPSPALLLRLYDEFCVELPKIAAKLGFDPRNIPYFDYERIVTTWLLELPGRAGKRVRQPKK